jgi:hypothetical protein
MDAHQCPYCSKALKSERGITQHIFQTPKCREAQPNSVSSSKSQQLDPNCDGAKDPNQEAEGDGLRRSNRNKRRKQDDPDMEPMRSRTNTNSHPDMKPNAADSSALDTSSDVDANRSTSYVYEDSYKDKESDATLDPVKEDEDYDLEDGVVKAQGFDTVLSVILERFVELQRTAMFWDLVCNGKLHRQVELVIFVRFVKCDTEESDLLCGKYLTRTKNMKQICALSYQ